MRDFHINKKLGCLRIRMAYRRHGAAFEKLFNFSLHIGKNELFVSRHSKSRLPRIKWNEFQKK